MEVGAPRLMVGMTGEMGIEMDGGPVEISGRVVIGMEVGAPRLMVGMTGETGIEMDGGPGGVNEAVAGGEDGDSVRPVVVDWREAAFNGEDVLVEWDTRCGEWMECCPSRGMGGVKEVYGLYGLYPNGLGYLFSKLARCSGTVGPCETMLPRVMKLVKIATSKSV